MTSIPDSTQLSTGIRFSTDQFAETDRIEAWRALFGHTICQTDIEPVGEEPFRSDVVLRALPGLGIASGYCSGARYWRPSRLIVDDDLIFVVNHIGTDIADMVGRQAEIGAGEAVLVTAGSVGGVINKVATKFTTIRIPRAALADMIPDIHAAMVKPVAASNGALGLLLNYVSVIEDRSALASEDSQRRIVGNVCDLIALSLGATTDATEVAKGRGVAAARLWSIKSDIRRSLAVEPVTAETLAARHGVTARYVQKLFEREGMTFSQFVQAQRMAAAHRMLRGRSAAFQTIAAVAAAVGFDDVVYFNRVFRRHFDRSPSQVRRAIAGEDDDA